MLQSNVLDQEEAQTLNKIKTIKNKINLKSLEQLNQVPTPRAGHSLTILNLNQEKEEMKGFLFGGANHEQGFLDDLYVLKFEKNLEKNEISLDWESVKLFSSTTGPEARYEHAALAIKRDDHKELLIMFGAGNEGPLNDVWSFNYETASWCQIETTGSIPCPRVLKSAGYNREKQRIYIFGGGLHNNTPVSDINTYCLDLKTLKWIMVSGAKAVCPPKRLGHSLKMIGSKMYLFGGLDENVAFNDIWVFDTDTNKWSEVETKGLKPTGRCAHTCTLLKSKLVFGGGMSPNPPTVHDSIYTFDTVAMEWEKYNFPEAKRLDHSAIALSDNEIIFTGGMDLQHIFQDSHILSV